MDDLRLEGTKEKDMDGTEMKILHYALGFPPYRTGGMTKFCMDLMGKQYKDGHQVALLWPGQMGFIHKSVSVYDRGTHNISGIHSYEVINPLPISYDEGIAEFQAFTNDCGSQVYKEFLGNYKPDVVHIHTLMGLHKGFLEAVKKRGIRLVFTAHDFFPICPKVTMFRHGQICESIDSCEECGVCNTTALSLAKIQVLQSPLYRILKDFSLIRKLRKQHRDGYLSERTADDSAAPVGTSEDFKNLRDYYGSMLSLMDIVHYNSTVTKSAYERIFELSNNCVIPITHSDVADYRRVKSYSQWSVNRPLRIRYLGPLGGSKGFFYSRRHLTNYGVKDRIFA